MLRSKQWRSGNIITIFSPEAVVFLDKFDEVSTGYNMSVFRISAEVDMKRYEEAFRALIAAMKA